MGPYGGASESDAASILESIVDCGAESVDEHYNVGKVIGEGRFSKVYAGSSKSSGLAIALKEIDIGTLEEDEEALEMLEAEVLALRRAGSIDGVVRLHEVVACQEAIFLAMERVPGRELFELVEERGALDAHLVKLLMQQLLTSLAALADLGVVHRDVKPENLMITEADGLAPRLTLIDFGYAALLGNGTNGNGNGNGLLSGVAGSPEYAAPEVLSWLEVEADETGEVQGEWYDSGCDVWSVGVTAHVLLSAELPFELPEGECAAHITHACTCTRKHNLSRLPPLPFSLSTHTTDGDEADIVAAARNMSLDFRNKCWRPEVLQPAKAFVRACMVADRYQRPNASTLLGHDWLSGLPPLNGGGGGGGGKANGGGNGVNARYLEMLEETIAIESAGGGGGGKAVPVGGPPAPLVQAL